MTEMDNLLTPNIRDSRRRRLLIEVSKTTGQPKGRKKNETRGPSSGRASPRYPPDLVLVRQPRLSDLLPARDIFVFMLGVLGLLAIGGILALELAVETEFAERSKPDLWAFDPEAKTSLGGWFSSVLLVLGAALSFAIYTLRKHRRDDFRGTYRIWVWVAIACVFLSIHEATGLMEALEVILAQAAGESAWQDLALWWMVPFGLFFAIVASRLYAELETHWKAKLLLVGGAACYLAGGMTWVPVISAWLSDFRPYVSQGARMLGYLGMVLAIVEAGRQVVEEAWAASTVPRKASARETNKPGRWIIVEGGHATPAGWHVQHFGQEEFSYQQRSSAVSPEEELSKPPPATNDLGQRELPPLGQSGNEGSVSAREFSVRTSVPGSFPSSLDSATRPSPTVCTESAPGSLAVPSQGVQNLRSAAFPTLGSGSSPANDSGMIAPANCAASVPTGLGGSSGVRVSGGCGETSAQSSGSTLNPPAPTNAAGIPRKLTKAEKKAIRKRLEELRAARERRLQEKQESTQNASGVQNS
jgi:hypothetical protein